MRRGLMSLAIFLSASTAFCAERVPARTWRRVKTCDMATLKQMDLPTGRIVGLRFNYRHARIQHLKPNWYEGSLWRYRRRAQDEFDYVSVMVAKADLESFKRIPDVVQSKREYLVYGQVLKDREISFTFLRLLGRKVRRDARGNAIVRW